MIKILINLFFVLLLIFLFGNWYGNGECVITTNGVTTYSEEEDCIQIVQGYKYFQIFPVNGIKSVYMINPILLIIAILIIYV
ncbi:unnamed protein product [Meloidogyne enterolobii]|uniref:Uncharacterized protein n=1 Tax=Meloidogyne enterolobii TaxID=390850 RepID=A0ACB0XVC6_MELEN